jgi:hypothetical protein
VVKEISGHEFLIKYICEIFEAAAAATTIKK